MELSSILRNCLLLAASLVVLGGAGPVRAADDQCGGIINATLSRDILWAHLDQLDTGYDPDEIIEITANDTASDEDYDGQQCECDGLNHVDLELTEWDHNTGTHYPETGECIWWTPDQWTDSNKVYATIKDTPTPHDDNDVVKEIDAFAYEVKVVMRMTDNTGAGHTFYEQSIWEHETTTLTNTWSNFNLSEQYIKWNGATQNGVTPNGGEGGTVHIEYEFLTVPGNADMYGGSIRAKLRTLSEATEYVNVEDVD